MSVEKRLQNAVAKAVRAEVLSKVLCGESAWLMLCKGGLENTFRDLMLSDIQVAIGRDRYVVTGERQRFDIAIYDRQALALSESSINWCQPAFVLELKFNYLSQGFALDRCAKDISSLAFKPIEFSG